MPLAYSYLRFSSPQQATGDSIRRQVQARQRWLDAHPGVRLDTSLVLTDAGRSAFRRKDWDTYALARFVEEIKAGRVAAGSYLLVENLDRVSRENAGEATELFLSIVNKGIIVVQLSPVVMEFGRPVDLYKLMFAVMELSRGHSESAIKSDRGRAFWARKHRDAAKHIVSRRLPGWIREVDGKLVLDDRHARTVRRMFALAKLGHGTAAIAKALNAEGAPMMGRLTQAARGQSHLAPEDRVRRPITWSGALIWHILTSTATIGEYVPFRRRGDPKPDAPAPVPGYYPSVIDPGTFAVVRGMIAARGRTGRGRKGRRVNLFSGLLIDAQDGGTLSYWNNGVHPCVLISVNAKEGKGAKWVSFPAQPFEQAICSKLAEVRVADMQQATQAEVLAGRLSEIDSLVRLWTAKMDDPAIVDTVAAKLAALKLERGKVAANLAEARRDACGSLADSWNEFLSLAELLQSDPSDELRLRVKAAIRQNITKLTCVFTAKGRYRLAAVRVDFAGGHRDYLIRFKMPFNNGFVRKPAVLTVRSFAESGVPAVDLRKPANAARIVKALHATAK